MPESRGGGEGAILDLLGENEPVIFLWQTSFSQLLDGGGSIYPHS